MTDRKRIRLALVLAAGTAFGANAGVVVDPPKRLPSLDELLGLRQAGAEDAEVRLPEEPGRTALDDKLSAEEAAEAFQQAVRLMEQTAARLDPGQDIGLVTQRLQEDAVRKLDAVIAAAMQNQQSSSSSSSSSSSQQEQQQQPNQQQREQQEAQSQESSQGDPSEGTPPGRRDGQMNSVELNAAAWGALPARLRDALVQGSSDRFSSIYQTMTEQYYRRLAEEPKR
ncbi:MAG: hypothetical protein KF705_06725 [Phycisphaeraceae bacterium]|nr:hypothetical protein [Phycisphaeraceae bacterium]